ncbi:HNH endonuclease, partial [Streptococcus pyogenes]|uniref:HNH endonuclease n=1 Tax=Streptococcus pyogenes TaxID=1314 RepID=UPI003DA1A53A
MSKYQPLADHLSGLQQDQVRLTFGEIERLAKLTLPKAAYNHSAWWANSRTRDSHGWAHLWLQAGWESCNLDLEHRTVEFRRAVPTQTAASIASLYPTTLEHLMDLLGAANIDVSAWSYRSDGTLVEKPKANPDYCYDWSFGSEDEGFVLCLWCDLMDESEGRITYSENVQELARDLERAARNPKLPADKKSRVNQQARRARAFDDALDFSYRKGRPLRVILNAGDIRSREEITEKASTVALRRLDPESWFVHRYSRETGECLVLRAVRPDSEPIEGALPESDGSPGADDARRLAEIKVRRGQAEFRQTLLAAYNRRCAVTGCAITDLLEAAHIVPHSEETNYRVTNGLLLRSDIHT